MTQQRSARPILEVARSLDLAPSQVVPYGLDKAKVTLDALDSGRPPGRLVLVSAITPTVSGERPSTLPTSRMALRLLKEITVAAKAARER